MSETSLSNEQKQALGLTESSLIAAGAGAGKTTTLVEAVVVDLENGILPEDIVVSTFTRAAATNLKVRIAEELIGRNENAVDTIEKLSIGTIDSIAIGLLKENALLVGMSPAIKIADERNIRRMQLKALEAANSKLGAEKLQSIASIADPTDDSIIPILVQLYKSENNSNQQITVPAGPGDDETIYLLDELATLQADMTPAAAAKVDTIMEAIDNGNPKQKALVRPRERDASFGVRKTNELHSTALSVNELLYDYCLKTINSISFDSKEALLELYHLWKKEFNIIKEQASVLEFDDVTSAILKFSETSEKMFAKAYIDEAQDTSPVQHRIFENLSKIVILVGDRNQSIYGFRGADIENFEKISSSYDRVELATNYRSSKEIVEFVNAYCSKAGGLGQMINMKSGVTEKGLVEIAVIESETNQLPSAKLEAALLADKIKALVTSGYEYKDICILVNSNSAVDSMGSALRSVHIPVIDIKKSGLLKQEECLDMLAYLELIADKGNQSALLRVISSPFLNLPLSQIAQVFKSDIPHESKLLEDFFKNFNSIQTEASINARLKLAIELHDYDLTMSLADQTGATEKNILKFIDLVELFEEYYGLSARNISEQLRNEIEIGDLEGVSLDDFNTDINAVKVMTVHQAKGAEFKVCLVSRMHLNIKRGSDDIAIHEGELGLRLDRYGPDSVLTAAIDLDHDNRSEEFWRNFYVALTRAKEHLLLVAGCRKKHTWGEPFQSFIDNNELMPDIEKALSKPVKRDGVNIFQMSRTEETFIPPSFKESVKFSTPIPTIDLEIPGALQMLNYTSLTNWNRCSYRRYLERDLKLRYEEKSQESNHGESRTIFGQEFHSILARADYSDLSNLKSKLDIFTEDQQERAKSFIDVLENSDLVPRINLGKYYTEKFFTTNLAEHLVNGSIDLLVEYSDNTALLVDYKTGEEKEVFAEDYLLQRKLYCYAGLSYGYKKVEMITYSFPDQDKAVYTQADLPALETELLDEINSILEKPPVPATKVEQPFCKGCPGLDVLCPVSEASVGEILES